MNGKVIIIVLFAVFGLASCFGQPVMSSKQLIGDLEIYRDFRNDQVFYYAPGDLTLSIERDGKPKFQLLEMRYTGSSAYGDAGDKRFMNVVQFSVSMEQVNAETLNSARQRLGRVDLRPLPIRNIDAFLVAPVGEGTHKGAYRKLGKDGSFQAEGENGASTKYGFWTERTFTLKLENHEAQLLWDQVAGGQLSLSLGYSVYADMISGGKADMKVSGDTTLTEGFESSTENMLDADTLVVTQLVKADAFPIYVDVATWPGLLKRIDVNEGVPPAYAALEVRCFDFVNDTRPDLAVKGIDIAATGVGGQTITLPTQKFLRAEPDLYARQIRFPYAVKLTLPYRYRLVEYTSDGEKRVSGWTEVQSWASHLDITTASKDNAFQQKEVEVEVPLAEFEDKQVTKVDVRLNYYFTGKLLHTVVTYRADDRLPIKQTSFRYDKDTPVTYETTWTFTDMTVQRSKMADVAADNYLYIIVPDR